MYARGTNQGSRGNHGHGRGRGQFNGDGNVDGRRPARIINVPVESRRKTWAQERRTIETVWATETGSSLEKAVQKVEQWIRETQTKSSGTTAWGKTPAFDPKVWSMNYLQNQTQQRKMQFTKEMPVELSSVYDKTVMVQWPHELKDEGVIMKDVFGTTFALLDSVRMEDEVFIKPLGSDRLEIRGSDDANLSSAVRHLNILIEKVRLQVTNSVWPKYITLDKRSDYGAGVVFEKAETWWPDTSSHPISPRLVRCAVSGSSPAEYWSDLQPDQRYIIQSELKRALDIARYEKGHYELSIILGCLAIKQHDLKFGAKQDTDVFIKDITDNEKLGCVVKKWLVNENDGEILLKRLTEADHLLEPTSTGIGGFFTNVPKTLAETKPTLRGSWVFMDPNGTAFNYVVQVHWSLDEDGVYEKDHSEFYRLPSGFKGPKEHLDVKLLELGEGKAWQFNLTSMSPVNRQVVPAAIHYFVNNLKINPQFDITSRSRFVEFKAGASLKVLAGRLDKIYTFGIRKTGYVLDLVSMWYPQKDAPCWGLNVYHNEWKSHLADLEQLQTGERADWGDTVSTFLPDNGFTATGMVTATPQAQEDEKSQPRDGIRILLIKLMEISQIAFQADSPEMPDYPAIPPSPRGLM